MEKNKKATISDAEHANSNAAQRASRARNLRSLLTAHGSATRSTPAAHKSAEAPGHTDDYATAGECAETMAFVRQRTQKWLVLRSIRSTECEDAMTQLCSSQWTSPNV